MNRITRHGEQTASEAAAALEQPTGEVRRLLDGLAEKGYVEREKKGNEWVYATRFARKRGRQIPGGIWSALGQGSEEE
jgi:DNA-binding IclR family transcriptional regulator